MVAVCLAALDAFGARAVAPGPQVSLSEADEHSHLSFSRFAEVTELAQTGTAHDRAEFAIIALDTLIDCHLDELDKAASQQVLDPQERRRRYGWRAGVAAYVEQLRDIREHIGTQSSIDIMIEQQGIVRMVIDERQVIIGGPRPAEQDRLEEKIAQSMCDLRRCSRNTVTIEEKVDAQSANLRQGWVFASQAPPTYATSDGLGCIFRDRKHIKLKQVACESLLRELRLLAEALKAVDSRGFPIYWQSLDIDRLGPQRSHRVIYDQRGRYFLLSLPALYQCPDIWRQAIPWIKAYASGNVRQHYIEPPESMIYLAKAPTPASK